MTKFSILKTVAAAALVIAFCAPAGAAEMSMKKRMQAYFDTVNKGDVAGAGAFYAPNAVIEDPVGVVVKSTAADFIKGAMGIGVKYELAAPLRGNMTIAADLKIHVGTKGILHAVEVYTFDATGHITKMQAIWGDDDREGQLN